MYKVKCNHCGHIWETLEWEDWICPKCGTENCEQIFDSPEKEEK